MQDNKIYVSGIVIVKQSHIMHLYYIAKLVRKTRGEICSVSISKEMDTMLHRSTPGLLHYEFATQIYYVLLII